MVSCLPLIYEIKVVFPRPFSTACLLHVVFTTSSTPTGFHTNYTERVHLETLSHLLLELLSTHGQRPNSELLSFRFVEYCSLLTHPLYGRTDCVRSLLSNACTDEWPNTSLVCTRPWSCSYSQMFTQWFFNQQRDPSIIPQGHIRDQACSDILMAQNCFHTIHSTNDFLSFSFPLTNTHLETSFLNPRLTTQCPQINPRPTPPCWQVVAHM